MESGKQKVLVVEADATLSTLIIEQLSKEGYEVYHAKDGLEAIDFANRIIPQLILLDMQLPIKDGYQVLYEIRNSTTQSVATTPIIIVSETGAPMEISRALQYKFSDYVVKSTLHMPTLVEKMKRTLSPNIVQSTPDRKVTLLIVEDDKFLRDLETQKLSKEQMTIYTAMDGEEGVALATEHKPDIILLDILLPGIDGFEVLSRIRQNPDLAKTLVIMLSNFGQRDDIEKARALGAEKFLIKANYTLDEIVEEVRTLVRTKLT